MKVFLTGGTGFVGQEILRQLHLEEHSVRMVVRDAGSMRAKAAVAEYGAELTVGDILETHQAEKQTPHPLRRRAFGGQAGPLPFRRGEGKFSARSRASALTGVQAVIHLVGIISEVSRSTFENVHTQGARNVVAAAQAAGVKRFIHMGALGTRLHASSRYHQTKWAAEEAVRASGLDYTIFRPSLIYGPQDQF